MGRSRGPNRYSSKRRRTESVEPRPSRRADVTRRYGTMSAVPKKAGRLDPTQPLLLAAFFASGFAALVYQTIWQRLLSLFGGADVYSVTIIVAAFMAGLGFGCLAGGYLADRLGARARLRVFAACESAVAAFALSSATVYYDVLYGRFGNVPFSRTGLAGIIFAVTLGPTFLMGMSLPLLARFPGRRGDPPAHWISRLYGWNTLGAACGSLVAVTWMLRSFDLRVSLQIGAAVSTVCAVTALVASAFLAPAIESSLPSHITRPSVGFSFRVWLMLYTLSGFVALSLEVVWFRVMGVMLKSNALTFGLLLAFYLAGLGIGSLLARGRRIQRWDARMAFLSLQAAVPLWAGGSFALLAVTVNRVALFKPLSDYLASPLPVKSAGLFALLYFWLPLVLVVPATTMMGLSFGVLQRAVQTDAALVGRRMGWLQAANILGATAGAIAAGMFLLGWLGSAGTFQLLAACGVSFLALRVYSQKAASTLGRVTLVAVLVLLALMPRNDSFWAALHGSQSDRVIVGEDGSGFVLLRLDRSDTKVFVAGISQSWLPYQGIHTALGALPALLHPRPEQIAVVGLASGDTAFSIGGRAETRVIDCIELMTPQLRVLQRLRDRVSYPGLDMLLTDPRVRQIVADGRAQLRRGTRRYDLVEADALMPWAASAGNLYSVEYFRLLRDSLNPGGFAVSWIPTARTLASFLSAFPYVLRLNSIAIGSLTPIVFDRALLQDRMRNPFTAHYYSAGGVDLAAALKPYLSVLPEAFDPSSDRRHLGDLNHDLFPRDEFGAR